MGCCGSTDSAVQEQPRNEEASSSSRRDEEQQEQEALDELIAQMLFTQELRELEADVLAAAGGDSTTDPMPPPGGGGVPPHMWASIGDVKLVAARRDHPLHHDNNNNGQSEQDDDDDAVMVQAEGESGPEGEEECALCLAEFEPGQSVRVLACGHVFHRACVDPWLARTALCPYCNACVLPTPLPLPTAAKSETVV